MARSRVARAIDGWKESRRDRVQPTGDPQLGDFDDAVILGQYGEVSADLLNLTPPE